ncbi:MAG: Asp-tRNA(Asn)/Glu-tRNA(Gln) amidotransferase subunit GatB [Bradymonadaceae bacterium]
MQQGDRFQPVIGLEIHCQLATATKLFSRAPNRFGGEPNTRVAPVEAGLPGSLPVIEPSAVRDAVRVGLALDCEVQPRSSFDRKHYFYPDLPKGYQITQHREPLCRDGELTVERGADDEVEVGIERLHLEEDAGKSIHGSEAGQTRVDLNRCGVPLIEIVTRPELGHPEAASAFLEALHELVVFLGVSDGEMSEGSLRCDANVSVRDRRAGRRTARTELKNLNSFKFVRDGLRHEIDRQVELLLDGEETVRQTRSYDPDTGRTVAIRQKEEERDYRYMPEPDLPPLRIDEETLEELRSGLPELPGDKRRRYREELGLDDDRAALLASDRELADWFETVVDICDCSAEVVASWTANAVLGLSNRRDLEPAQLSIEPADAACVLEMIEAGTIDDNAGDEVLEILLDEGGEPEEIVEERGLAAITDESRIEQWVRAVVEANPDEVESYRDGKTKLIGWFIGQVMQRSNGRADAEIVRRLLRDELEA